MAVADASYRLLMVDVGEYGKDSDGSLMVNSKFYQRIENGSLALPTEIKLPNSNVLAPFVFIGDAAFPLRNYLMRSFLRKQCQENEKQYYNYRHARARMTTECAFGIASSKFRILIKSIETKVENADHIVKAICILRNTIINLEKKSSTQHYVFEDYRTDTSKGHKQMISLNCKGRANNRASSTAINIRYRFVKYFMDNKI